MSVKLAFWILGGLLWATAANAADRVRLIDVEAELRSDFPRSKVQSFECSGAMCKGLVSHPMPDGDTFGVTFIVERDSSENVQTISCMMMAPSMTDDAAGSAYAAAVYAASAVSVISVTSPHFKTGERLPFALRTVDAGNRGIDDAGWHFSAGSSIVSTFSAKRTSP